MESKLSQYSFEDFFCGVTTFSKLQIGVYFVYAITQGIPRALILYVLKKKSID